MLVNGSLELLEMTPNGPLMMVTGVLFEVANEISRLI